MESPLIVAPLLIPMITAILCLFTYRNLRNQRILACLGGVAFNFAAIKLLLLTLDKGYLKMDMGSWPAPYGITFVVDILSAIMVLLAAIMYLSTAVYSIYSVHKRRQSFFYFPLLNFMMMGIVGSFLTGDLFNMYVWFEVMLISSFVLLSLGGEIRQLEGSIKYVTLNLLSSTIFLCGLGILYGELGTLNMADIALKLQTTAELDSTLIASSASLFLVAFAIKSAMFPFFFWLPASYHTPPTAISALFAGLLTKVGVYSLIRAFTLVFVESSEFFMPIIIFLSILPMIPGVLGAAPRYNIKEILSFHIISQIGYMTLGLGLFTEVALTGTIFYLMHHIIVKTNLFLIGGVIEKIKGTQDLKKIGGLYKKAPFIAILFLIPAMSLGGIPPLSGFWAKFLIIKAAISEEAYISATLGLLVGVMTLFSMTKIWAEAFWKKQPGENDENTKKLPSPDTDPAAARKMLVPVFILAAMTVAIGFTVEPLYKISKASAKQLKNPQGYIETVLSPEYIHTIKEKLAKK